MKEGGCRKWPMVDLAMAVMAVMAAMDMVTAMAVEAAGGPGRLHGLDGQLPSSYLLFSSSVDSGGGRQDKAKGLSWHLKLFPMNTCVTCMEY